MKKKAIELRQILKDRNAQLQCDTQIRESQRYIEYFTEELKRLQTKGNRASFILNNSNSSITEPDNNEGPVPQQLFADSPRNSFHFMAVEEPEEEDLRRKYTNLGKRQHVYYSDIVYTY